MSLFLLDKLLEYIKSIKKLVKLIKKRLTAPANHAINKYNNKQEEFFTVTQYRIEHKKGGYLPGEEIKLEKVTTAERIGNAALKALYFFIAVLFIFNLIRFIF